MPTTTDRSGVACCGNCGSQLEVRCTGGCAEPDAVFAESFVGTMRRPRAGNERPQEYKDLSAKPPATRKSKGVKYPPPTHCYCGDPVAQRAKVGVGRPPTKCEKHVIRKKVAG